MVEITVSSDNFEALMYAHPYEKVLVRHKNLKGEIWLEKKYDKRPVIICDSTPACVCIDTKDIYEFTQSVSKHLAEGYKVSSSACGGIGYKAILIKED